MSGGSATARTARSGNCDALATDAGFVGFDAHVEQDSAGADSVAAARGRVDLGRFDNSAFDRGASRLKEVLWVLVRSLVFAPSWLHANRLKCSILRAFGATVGQGVVIKPGVRITFPWRLRMDDHVWIGEDAYLLNLAPIRIGSNVCISQRAFLCTGNHDYGSAEFRLMTAPILVEDGAWIGAASWVAPGVVVGSHAVLTAGSVATTDLQPYAVYRGNPACRVRERFINTGPKSADKVTRSL